MPPFLHPANPLYFIRLFSPSVAIIPSMLLAQLSFTPPAWRALFSDFETDRELQTNQDVGNDGLWKVIIFNDDVTPMEFVVMVLVKIFGRPLIIAEAIMWEAHHNGQAVVVALPKAEAEKRVHQATFAARLEGYPLRLAIEEAD